VNRNAKSKGRHLAALFKFGDSGEEPKRSEVVALCSRFDKSNITKRGAASAATSAKLLSLLLSGLARFVERNEVETAKPSF